MMFKFEQSVFINHYPMTKHLSVEERVEIANAERKLENLFTQYGLPFALVYSIRAGGMVYGYSNSYAYYRQHASTMNAFKAYVNA